MVCMHCEDPTCAEVCPADAIKQNEDGIVQSALKPRCIGCSNCVLACPFGVPKYDGRARPDDEVRHVLRPHLDRAQRRCARRCARARRCGSARRTSSPPPDPASLADDVRVRYTSREDEGADGGARPGRGRRHARTHVDRTGSTIRSASTTQEVRPVTGRSRRPPEVAPRLPVHLRRRGRRHPPGVHPLPRARLRAPSRPAPSAVAVWSSLRSINHGEPRPIVRLDDVPVNGTHLFGYPTKDDPAILVRLPGDRAARDSARSAPIWLRRLLRARQAATWCVPVTRACSTHAPGEVHRRPTAAAARTHRRRGAQRHRLGARRRASAT